MGVISTRHLGQFAVLFTFVFLTVQSMANQPVLAPFVSNTPYLLDDAKSAFHDLVRSIQQKDPKVSEGIWLSTSSFHFYLDNEFAQFQTTRNKKLVLKLQQSDQLKTVIEKSIHLILSTPSGALWWNNLLLENTDIAVRSLGPLSPTMMAKHNPKKLELQLRADPDFKRKLEHILAKRPRQFGLIVLPENTLNNDFLTTTTGYSLPSNYTFLSFKNSELTYEEFLARLVHEIAVRLDIRYIDNSSYFFSIYSRNQKLYLIQKFSEEISFAPNISQQVSVHDPLINDVLSAIRAFQIEKNIFSLLQLTWKNPFAIEMSAQYNDSGQCFQTLRKMMFELKPAENFHKQIRFFKAQTDPVLSPMTSVFCRSRNPQDLQMCMKSYWIQSLHETAQQESDFKNEDTGLSFTASRAALKAFNQPVVRRGSRTETLCQFLSQPELGLYSALTSFGPRPRNSGSGN